MRDVMSRLRASSGPISYQREIRQFLWRHRSENETDLVLVSGDSSLKVHTFILLPLSSLLQELLPTFCPCTKLTINLPPFPRHILSAAIEIMYTGQTTGLSSTGGKVKVRQVFSLLKVKADCIEFEGEITGGEYNEMDGGVTLKLEDDMVNVKVEVDDTENLVTTNKHRFDAPQQDSGNYYLDDTTGMFIEEKKVEVMNEGGDENEDLMNVELEIRRDLKRRQKDIKETEKQRPLSSEEKVATLAAKKAEEYERKMCSIANQSIKKHICSKCDFKTNRKNNLEVHFKRKHQKSYSNCSQCDYQTKSKRYLQMHILKWHNNVTPVINILENESSQDPLSVPQKSNYECGQCNYTTTSKRYLQRHTLRWHTENLNPKIYYCDQCDFKSRWKRNIQKHIDGVHAKKTYYCDQCNFETKWEGNLKLHIDGTHANIKYCCDQCDYKTTWKMNLKKHVDSGHRRIYYNCENCDYKTNWKTHLYRHMKVHDKILVDEQSSNTQGYLQDLRCYKKQTLMVK